MKAIRKRLHGMADEQAVMDVKQRLWRETGFILISFRLVNINLVEELISSCIPTVIFLLINFFKNVRITLERQLNVYYNKCVRFYDTILYQEKGYGWFCISLDLIVFEKIAMEEWIDTEVNVVLLQKTILFLNKNKVLSLKIKFLVLMVLGMKYIVPKSSADLNEKLNATTPRVMCFLEYRNL